ncbi:MAG TPA: hypothetical protein VFH51_13180, partial [Myxococcota bacterium]|nr:hypothetical protein [Myxococcota bacterium]
MGVGAYASYEVHGHTITRLVNEGSPWAPLVEGVLLTRGIATARDGDRLQIHPDTWYPLDVLLELFEAIRAQAGDEALVEVGGAVPRSAPFPPSLRDVPSALKAVNEAYHANHRKEGRLLKDPETGALLPGLGDYTCSMMDAHEAGIRSDTPYPCPFDLGLVTALALRFAPG